MSDDRKKIGSRHVIDDRTLAQVPNDVAQLIIGETIIGTLGALAGAARDERQEIDWTTLDLRVFRDTSLETQERDPWLLVRADALTKGSTS